MSDNRNLMNLSEHFALREFEIDDEVPEECIEIAQQFCMEVLEPVRDFIDAPMRITSGYRPPAANEEAHGVKNSEHIWTPRWCAADFDFPVNRLSVRAVFDWIRNNPSIPFHQVILEHGATGSSIIHISYNLDKIGTRQALEGATHNASPYTSWAVATYIPSTGGQDNG